MEELLAGGRELSQWCEKVASELEVVAFQFLGYSKFSSRSGSRDFEEVLPGAAAEEERAAGGTTEAAAEAAKEAAFDAAAEAFEAVRSLVARARRVLVPVHPFFNQHDDAHEAEEGKGGATEAKPRAIVEGILLHAEDTPASPVVRIPAPTAHAQPAPPTHTPSSEGPLAGGPPAGQFSSGDPRELPSWCPPQERHASETSNSV